MRQRRDDSFDPLPFVLGQANVRRVPKGWRYALLPQRDHGVKKSSREPGKIERLHFPELYYSIAGLLFAPSDGLRVRLTGRDGLGRINPAAAQKFSGRAGLNARFNRSRVASGIAILRPTYRGLWDSS